jgi:8-oxo-dGTP diphosphatase
MMPGLLISICSDDKMILHDTTAIVVKKGDKFLLIKRGEKPEKGYWAVPGGHVDKGETQYECARREAKEEVGEVKITSKKPVYVFVHDVDIGHRHKAHIFLGEVVGKIKAGSDAKEFSWFTIKQMRKIELTHYTKKVFNKLYSREV